MIDFKAMANKIWSVADLLRGDYKQSDYGKIILPMTVLRRLDCILAPTKQAVVDYLPKIEKLSDSAKDLTLNKVAKLNFHNRSKFDFEKIKADPTHVAANLRNYINGFSYGASEIVEYFNFDDHISRMDDPQADLLFKVVKEFAVIDLAEKIIKTGRDGTPHSARSLSDGTLRFLALAVLELDTEATGLLCLEEPENGIHPERIPAMLDLLKDISMDTEEPIGADNPLRQVIINTHSPAVVAQIPDDSLLVAESFESKNTSGKRCKSVRFSPLADTWRQKKATGEIAVVSKGKLLSYLNPVAPNEPDHGYGISDKKNNVTHLKRRVIDRADLQPYLPQSLAEKRY